MSEPTIYIISAPSGCGKGTLISKLNERYKIYNSISCTTRRPRSGEMNGVDYYFITPETYNRMVEEDGFFEHAGFDRKAYGTPKKPIEDALNDGMDVLLEIEPNGAFQVKEKKPDSVMIFILPPSLESLERRLRRRAEQSGESEDQIQSRIKTAIPVIKRAYEYDYVMVNGDLDKAVSDLYDIVTKAKNGGEGLEAFTKDSMKKTIDEVLENA